MKKFQFSLETVLNYKSQILDGLTREHGIIIAEIVQKEAEIKTLENNYNQYKEGFNTEKEKGMSINDALSRESHIRVLQHDIEMEREQLKKMHIRENEKRKEVVAAKTETSSFEKLREKRLEEYNKMNQKAEELFIEEFVSNKTTSQV